MCSRRGQNRGGGKRVGEVRVATQRLKCWVESAWMGGCVGACGRGGFFVAFKKWKKCATATPSQCKGCKKNRTTAVGALVSYDGTEPSQGWVVRVVGGVGGQGGGAGEVGETWCIFLLTNNLVTRVTNFSKRLRWAVHFKLSGPKGPSYKSQFNH